VLYTYQTSVNNLLHDSKTGNTASDYFTITFLSPFTLAPNSYYNISASNSANYISEWSASDSLFGIYLTGSNAPISLVPAPGLIAGGPLTYCVANISCLGGAIATNDAGQIDQWNLVADSDSDQPFVTFITYNNSLLKRADAFAFGQDGGTSFENQLSGQAGSWNGFTPSGTGGVPEPSTWAMTFAGFAGLGWLARMRNRKLTDPTSA
jgi:PEP-CTERM motif-containing protein